MLNSDGINGITMTVFIRPQRTELSCEMKNLYTASSHAKKLTPNGLSAGTVQTKMSLV